jgi:hypothetical protein
MNKPKREVIVPREQAVFRMDRNGTWHNEHGKFEHPKIIAFFNASIRKDEGGYHVFQETHECVEKVYFPFEDTALFVVDLALGPPAVLTLNTRARMSLDPSRLHTRGDALYLDTDEHRIKFSERALLKLSAVLDDREGSLFITLDGNSTPIPEK